jgi:ribonuclease VapC
MIVDSSALLAVLKEERETDKFIELIDGAPHCRISAVNYVETAAMVDSNRDPVMSRRFEDFLQQAEIEIEPVTTVQARIAREAYRDFGKGSGHRARLNFGDCFAYALAKERGEPLLFKGDDFSYTDIACAVMNE